MGQFQGGDPQRPRSRRHRPRRSLPRLGLPGSDRVQLLKKPGQAHGGGCTEVRHPKRVRWTFSGQFSRAFCPNWDPFGQNARENWPALGSPADHPALRGPGPFHARAWGSRPEKAWKGHGPWGDPGHGSVSRAELKDRWRQGVHLHLSGGWVAQDWV